MFEDITSDGFSGKNPSKGRRSAHCAKEGEHSTVDLYLISCRCPKGLSTATCHSQPREADEVHGSENREQDAHLVRGVLASQVIR